jgi:hypothetical protein
MKMLIENKAMLKYDDRGESAFEYAIKADSLECIKILRRHFGPEKVDK